MTFWPDSRLPKEAQHTHKVISTIDRSVGPRVVAEWLMLMTDVEGIDVFMKEFGDDFAVAARLLTDEEYDEANPPEPSKETEPEPAAKPPVPKPTRKVVDAPQA